MKKILLTMFMAVTTIVAMAQTKTYTDNLTVTINGNTAAPQETNIYVEENADGIYTLSLKNFILADGEDVIPVGNIVLDNITVTEENGVKIFAVNRNIFITAGDEEGFWMGPMLGEVPVNLTGKMNAEKLYCTIDIDMSETLGQMIKVVFGKDEFAGSGNTTVYTDELTVTINGNTAAPQETNIYVEENADGTYTLSLKNFILADGVDVIPVGNIVLDNITVTEENGVKIFAVNRNIFITAGDEEGFWMGPMLGEVPVNLIGKMNAEKLYCTIDIDMSETLGQMIKVVFGKDDSFTGINGIVAENGTKRIFDITGREIKEITAPGIYIVNGKKIFVR